MIYKYEKRSYKTFFRRKNSRRFIKNELRSGTRAKKRRNEIISWKFLLTCCQGSGFDGGKAGEGWREAGLDREEDMQYARESWGTGCPGIIVFFSLNFQNFACSASPSSTGRCYLTLHWNLLRAWFALSYMQKSWSKLGKLKVCQFVLKRWLIKMVRI